MSLSHAILGLLRQEPMTGYDLKTRCFDQSINYFWPADQAQIYRTLDKLVDQGWVSFHIETQSPRPSRKVYSLTPAGLVELDRWLQRPQPLPLDREPFLVQLFFAKEVPNEALLGLIRLQAEAHQRKLEEYLHIPLPDAHDPQAAREDVLARLTLDLGIQIEQAYLDWLAEARGVVQQLKPGNQS